MSRITGNRYFKYLAVAIFIGMAGFIIFFKVQNKVSDDAPKLSETSQPVQTSLEQPEIKLNNTEIPDDAIIEKRLKSFKMEVEKAAKEVEKLKEQKARLKFEYTSDWPEVIKVSDKLEKAEARLQKAKEALLEEQKCIYQTDEIRSF